MATEVPAYRLTTPVASSTATAAGKRPTRLTLLVAFSLGSAGGLAAIVTLVVIANPHADFPTTLVEPLVLNELSIKVRLYDKLPEPPQVVVLGASTVETLDAGAFAGRGRAFNFGISAGGLADSLAILRWLLEERGAPDDVLAGLTIDHFEDQMVLQWFTRVSPQTGPHSEDPAGLADDASRVPRALQVAYLKDSIRALRYEVLGHPSGNYQFHADGVRDFPAMRADLEGGRVDVPDRVAGLVPQIVRRHAQFTHPMPDQVARAASLVEEARAAGTEVRLVLLPYNPVAYRALAADPSFVSMHAQVRGVLQGECGPGVHVYDFTDPSLLDLDARWFYDEWHFLGPVAEEVVAAAFAAEYDLCEETTLSDQPGSAT